MTKTGSPVKIVGPGYEEIYKTKYLKFELSKTTLRRTTYGSRGETETLFFKVSDLETIKKLEYRSERWQLWSGDKKSRYYFKEQRDAKGKKLGCIKMIEKSKEKANNPKDWLYFERRKISRK